MRASIRDVSHFSGQVSLFQRIQILQYKSAAVVWEIQTFSITASPCNINDQKDVNDEQRSRRSLTSRCPTARSKRRPCPGAAPCCSRKRPSPECNGTILDALPEGSCERYTWARHALASCHLSQGASGVILRYIQNIPYQMLGL